LCTIKIDFKLIQNITRKEKKRKEKISQHKPTT